MGILKNLKKKLRPYLPRNIQDTLWKIRNRGCAHCHIFSEKPAVVCLTWAPDRVILHELMEDRPLTLLYLFFWSVTAQGVVVTSKLIRDTLKRYPKHRVVMLCNELFTVDRFRAHGVEAIFCNHNCYVNENFFNIDPGAVKKYDAIYNAAMAPYKRHELAAKIDSLALITYRYGGTHTGDYEQRVRAALGHADWVVDAFRDSQKATAAEVARYYNQSRVGLCLSAREGAMFASVEYLLCGLPVVTTRNTGGRDAFFNSEYVEWVDDTPEAVSRGVAGLIARAPGAALIREKTLAKMEKHRQRLRELLKDTLPQVEIPWPPGTHGPFTFRNLSELGRRLRAL